MNATARKTRSNWLDTMLSQCLHKLINHRRFASHPRRRETSPECPPCPLKDMLSVRIFAPFFGTVVLVSITLDGQARVIAAFDYQHNTEQTNFELRSYPIATPGQHAIDTPLTQSHTDLN